MGKTQVPLRLENCWQASKLSDIEVQIIEEEPEQGGETSRPGKRQCTRADSNNATQALKFTIPCSKALLSAASEYFRTRLLSELEEGATVFPLVVGHGEAEAAMAVIKSIYEGLPEDATVPQLVLMYKLADRLQATSTGLIAEALVQLPAEAWSWEDIIMVGYKADVNYLLYSVQSIASQA
jgi:hypothetical protein